MARKRSKGITVKFKHMPAGTGLAFIRGLAGLPPDPTTTPEAETAARGVAASLAAAVEPGAPTPKAKT